MADAPDLRRVLHKLLRLSRDQAEINRQLLEVLADLIGPEPGPSWIPTELQRDILAALKGKALRTDAIISKVDCARSTLFADPGGIHELQERGQVAHHPRIGFYRPDAPPPELQGKEG